MKIFVTGASGFLGREVALSAVRRGHGVIAIGGSHQPEIPGARQALHLDLSRPQNLEGRLLAEFPDAIINCAALSSLDACVENPSLAAALNADLPGFLARIANHLSARLVHISTDMVFDGKHAPYANTATPAPLHLYGATKLSGEKETLKYGKTFAVVLRVSPLSGNSLSGVRGLHERLVARWAKGEVTSLFTDEIRQPVSVTNLADVLVELCERGNLSGVYHWAGAEALSRYEIGRRIAEHFGLRADDVVAPAEQGLEAAGRPRDLTLELHPLRGKLKTPVQSFEEILSELRVPAAFVAWHEAKTGRSAPVLRFVKGVDF
jgi:dTDP-4-dehydrorhamnose reductase